MSHLGLRLKQRSVLSFNTPSSQQASNAQNAASGDLAQAPTPGLSRAMSAMCVERGGTQDLDAANANANANAPPPVAAAPSQGGGGMDTAYMSQGMPMFTPDFITPVDAQFACVYDPNEKENKARTYTGSHTTASAW